MAKATQNAETDKGFVEPQGAEQQEPQSKAAQAWAGFMSNLRKFSTEEIITIKIIDEIILGRKQVKDISMSNLAAINEYLNEGANPDEIADEKQMMKYRLRKANRFFAGKGYSSKQVVDGNEAFSDIATDDAMVAEAFKSLQGRRGTRASGSPSLFDTEADKANCSKS